MISRKFPPIFAFVASIFLCLPTSFADHGDEFIKLDLESLFEIEVDSVSRRKEKLLDSPANIFVITNDDLRRSGHLHLPEALRMVPGLDVARIDASKWAISTRGFNGRFNRMQLVQIDGRSVYTPLFSGVFWHIQDTVLEDVEQIEVLHGPGGTQWGANAVHGIISIKSKRAQNTQGWLASAGVGISDNGFSTLRYGGVTNDDVFYRVYVKQHNHGAFESESLFPIHYQDSWRRVQSGFRVDYEPTLDDDITIQGDYFYGAFDEHYYVPDPANPTPPGSGLASVTNQHFYRNANIITNWVHRFDDHNEIIVKAYYDRQMIEAFSTWDASIDTYDLDFQQHLNLFEKHSFVWGVNARTVKDRLSPSDKINFTQESLNDKHYSLFVQDTISLQEKWDITLGIKAEHYEHTNSHFSPSARMLYKIFDNHRVWASVSKAERVPSRVNRHIQLSTVQTPLGAHIVSGSEDFQSDRVIAYEGGYRHSWRPGWLADVSFFYHDLENLEEDVTLGATSTVLDNLNRGNIMGVNAHGRAELPHGITAKASYTWQITEMVEGLQDDEEYAPRHLASLGLSYQVRHNLSLENNWDYTGKKNSFLFSQHVNTPGYLRMDLGVIYQPSPHWEIAVHGQNLLEPRHTEAPADSFIAAANTQVERNFFIKATAKF